jgi:hypothetical protein
VGFGKEADQIGAIRNRSEWSQYAVGLLRNFQAALFQDGGGGVERLRFLLYPKGLSEGDRNWVRGHMGGVRWLGEDGRERGEQA